MGVDGVGRSERGGTIGVLGVTAALDGVGLTVDDVTTFSDLAVVVATLGTDFLTVVVVGC